jgi:hypothetical protein
MHKSVIFKWVWIGLMWRGTETSGGSCEHYNEASGTIEGGKFLTR